MSVELTDEEFEVIKHALSSGEQFVGMMSDIHSQGKLMNPETGEFFPGGSSMMIAIFEHAMQAAVQSSEKARKIVGPCVKAAQIEKLRSPKMLS